MKEKIYAVLDAKAEVFMPLFQARTPGAAERSFTDVVNSENHQFSQHPEDFILYELGTIDVDVGVIEPHKPRIIVHGNQVKHGETATNESERTIGTLESIQ